MLGLYYFFFDKYCDVTKFKELEMDKDSHYLALSEPDLCDCIRLAMNNDGNSLRNGDCTNELSANSTTIVKHPIRSAKQKKHNRREPGPLKNELHCTEKICLGSKTHCCYESQSNKFKFTGKGLKKRTL